MRHRKRKGQLSRTESERNALLSNQVASLFTHQAIKTTLAKAKETRRLAEKLITLAKEDSLHHRRLVFRFLKDKKLIKMLFKEIAPLFAPRQGGYTRIYQLGQRQGDAAKMAMLELVEKRVIKVVEKKKEARHKTAEPKKIVQPSVIKPEVADKGTTTDAAKKKVEHKKNWLKSVKNLFGKKEQ